MSLSLPQVKVVELKVTWITKSYSPKGSDSVYPPLPPSHRRISAGPYRYYNRDRNASGCLPPYRWLSLLGLCLLVVFRVRRLGYYDHTQRQLGERALYVFPPKGDATHITCEGPDGPSVLPEDPVVRKVWRHLFWLCVAECRFL